MTKPSCECGTRSATIAPAYWGVAARNMASARFACAAANQKSGESAAVPVVEDLERA